MGEDPARGKISNLCLHEARLVARADLRLRVVLDGTYTSSGNVESMAVLRRAVSCKRTVVGESFRDGVSDASRVGMT